MGTLQRILIIIKKSILEILFPRLDKCITCGKEDVEGICDKCRNKIAYSYDEEEMSIGYYGGPLKKLILNLKCKSDFESGDVLVQLVKERIKDISKNYCITYIPISKNSLKTRGFNQCEYIAKELGFECNLKVINTLIRIKEGKTQKTLRKDERLENLKGAFAAIDKSLIKGKSFILIDDVITTGATINEAIRVLKECDAKEIKILTLAKSHI